MIILPPLMTLTVLSSTVSTPPTYVGTIRYQLVPLWWRIRSFGSLENCFRDTKVVEADKSLKMKYDFV